MAWLRHVIFPDDDVVYYIRWRDSDGDRRADTAILSIVEGVAVASSSYVLLANKYQAMRCVGMTC